MRKSSFFSVYAMRDFSSMALFGEKRKMERRKTPLTVEIDEKTYITTYQLCKCFSYSDTFPRSTTNFLGINIKLKNLDWKEKKTRLKGKNKRKVQTLYVIFTLRQFRIKKIQIYNVQRRKQFWSRLNFLKNIFFFWCFFLFVEVIF